MEIVKVKEEEAIEKMVERDKQVSERTTRMQSEKFALSSMVNSSNVKQLKEHEEDQIRKLVKSIY